MAEESRIDRLRTLMEQRGYDAVVLRNNPDLRWLTGASRVFDAEAAHEAGLPCVGLTMGHTCEPQELVDAGCCALCDTVDDLRRVLLG